jgi:hypothetical protein
MFSYTHVSSVESFSATYSASMNQTVLNNQGAVIAIIDPNTFAGKTINNITSLFEYSDINPPISVGKFRFGGFRIGTSAFFCSALENIDDNFVNNNNISSIINVDKMFYQNGYGLLRTPTVTGLSTFVSKILNYPNISKYNIAGNLTDNNIPEQYKANTSAGDSVL